MDKQTDLKRPLLTGSFRDRESAERAYTAMTTRGYKPDEIHVIMSDETRKRLFNRCRPKTRATVPRPIRLVQSWGVPPSVSVSQTQLTRPAPSSRRGSRG